MAKEKSKPAKKEESNISKDMIIGQLIEKYPKSVPVLFDHGLHCIGCHVAAYESIAQACEGHGVDCDKLMIDLNKIIEKKAKK